jgi:hypothetical protein
MRSLTFPITLAIAFSFGLATEAGVVVLDTYSTAKQTITSPLLSGGEAVIIASGPQHFTFDLTTNVATVTSAFTGNDLPIAALGGATVAYDLYNTTTTGTVVLNGSGTYDIDFQLLFELKITSPGPLFGLTFETLTNSNFSVHGLPTLYIPPGTVFQDLTGGSDVTPIYIKGDPSSPVGTSSGRTVTINTVVPEPSSLLLGAVAISLTGAMIGRNRRVS